MDVMVGGRTCSAAASFPKVSGPGRRWLDRADSIEGVTPAWARCRSRAGQPCHGQPEGGGQAGRFQAAAGGAGWGARLRHGSLN